VDALHKGPGLTSSVTSAKTHHLIGTTLPLM
jgi:hypothetical protein